MFSSKTNCEATGTGNKMIMESTLEKKQNYKRDPFMNWTAPSKWKHSGPCGSAHTMCCCGRKPRFILTTWQKIYNKMDVNFLPIPTTQQDKAHMKSPHPSYRNQWGIYKDRVPTPSKPPNSIFFSLIIFSHICHNWMFTMDNKPISSPSWKQRGVTHHASSIMTFDLLQKAQELPHYSWMIRWAGSRRGKQTNMTSATQTVGIKYKIIQWNS